MGRVAHIRNPSLSGGAYLDNWDLRAVMQKVMETLSQPRSWVWWCVPFILAMAGSINRKMMVQARLSKTARSLSPKQPKQKGLEAWLKW
jgi:hypothetical protein